MFCFLLLLFPPLNKYVTTEDLIYRDVSRYSERFVAFQDPESFNGKSVSATSSSTSNNLGTVRDIHKLETSSLQDRSGCEIIERKFYYGGIHFILKGYILHEIFLAIS